MSLPDLSGRITVVVGGGMLTVISMDLHAPAPCFESIGDGLIIHPQFTLVLA